MNSFKKHPTIDHLFVAVVIFCSAYSFQAQGYSTVTLTSISETGVNYVVGGGFVCALDPEQGVVCDGEDVPAEGVPSLKLPVEQLTAGNGHVCALDADGLVCWGRMFEGRGERILVGERPSFIAAGSDFTCYSNGDGTKCMGPDTRFGKLNPPHVENAAWISLGVSGGCVLGKQGERIECWGLGHRREPIESQPLSSIGVYGSDGLCGVSQENDLFCWSVHGDMESFVEGIEKIALLSTSLNQACVLADRGIGCWESDSIEWLPNLDGVIGFAGGNDTFCGTGSDGGTCWEGEEISLGEEFTAIMGGVSLFNAYSFNVRSIEEHFYRLAEFVYDYKGDFLNKTAKHLEGFKIAKSDKLHFAFKKVLVRSLVLMAAEPAILEMNTETLSKFRKIYSAAVQKNNEMVGLKSLADIDLNRDTFLTSVRLMRFGLEASRRYMADPQDRQVLEKLIADLGRIEGSLGNGGFEDKLDACNDILQQSENKQLNAKLIANSRVHGFGVMISALTQYLNDK